MRWTSERRLNWLICVHNELMNKTEKLKRKNKQILTFSNKCIFLIFDREKYRRMDGVNRESHFFSLKIYVGCRWSRVYIVYMKWPISAWIERARNHGAVYEFICIVFVCECARKWRNTITYSLHISQSTVLSTLRE